MELSKHEDHSKCKHEEKHNENWLFSRTGLVTCGFLAAIAFLMFTGHTAHLLGALPYLLLLACPLMHLFMMSGHGHGCHGHHHSHDEKPQSEGDSHGTH